MNTASVGELTDGGALASVALRVYFNAGLSGVGTGFIVSERGFTFLLTNYHVLSGCDPDTGKSIDKRVRPDRVLAAVLTKREGSHLSSWSPCVQRVLDEADAPLWIEHPTHGRAFDVVALPFELPPNPIYFDWTKPIAPKPLLALGSELFIAGFPLGVSGPGVTAVWKTGNVATDLGMPVDHKDYFLIDANTREGMSGSPVFARRVGMYTTESGASFLVQKHPIQTWPLGVYAGRQSPEKDMTLGRVWRWNGVQELIDHACEQVENRLVGPQPCLLGRFVEDHDVVTIANTSTVVSGRQWTAAELLQWHVRIDPRLGGSIDRVERAAGILAACNVKPDEDIRLTRAECQLVKMLETLDAPTDSTFRWKELETMRAAILAKIE